MDPELQWMQTAQWTRRSFSDRSMKRWDLEMKVEMKRNEDEEEEEGVPDISRTSRGIGRGQDLLVRLVWELEGEHQGRRGREHREQYRKRGRAVSVMSSADELPMLLLL